MNVQYRCAKKTIFAGFNQKNMSLKSQIQSLAKEQYESVIAMRRHIHAHPELSFKEKKTALYVKEQLQSWGIKVQSDIAGHGLVGCIKGKKETSDQVIALRADMDALPIMEENEVEYRSQNKGVMHACGHDVHTSSLIGTARILSQLTNDFSGTIKLIFQPAEERLPGGASLMIKEGVLKSPDVSAILGQHVQPFIESGKIGIRPGMFMASADEIYLSIKGKGGHAAHPSKFIDPIAISAQIITALQQVVSRSDTRIPSILSFGKIIAEGATNIIPKEVYIEGTFRTMDEPWRAKAHQKIERIVRGIAESFGAKADIEIKKGYPVLFNDENLTLRTRSRIADYIGEENVIDLDLWMGAEDFAYYTHEVPGCFYRLGTRNEAKGIVHGLHTSRFNIDEPAMELSTGLMAWLAVNELNGE